MKRIYLVILVALMTCINCNILSAQGLEWPWGESEFSVRNPPDAYGEWNFYGNQAVYITLTNYNVLPVYAVLEWPSYNRFEHFSLLPGQDSDERRFDKFGYVPISWKFVVYIKSDSGWVIGKARWSLRGM